MAAYRAATAALASAIVLAGAELARAQAFMPPKGEGTVSLVAQDALVRKHLVNFTAYDRGHMRWQSLIVDATYGVSDRVAVSVSVPYVRSKYYGPFPHQRRPDDPDYRVSPDDGAYHSTLQDFHFAVRYGLKRDGLMITPYAGTIQPSHDYEYFAHSAVGRNLRQLEVGTYVARVLDPILPGAFVQARIAQAFLPSVLDIGRSQTHLDVEWGYFVTPSVRVYGLSAGQVTHGGVDISPASRDWPYPLWSHHDQIGRENFLNLGAGAAVDLSDSIAVFGTGLRTVGGRNTHAMDYSFSLGVTYTFRQGDMMRAMGMAGHNHQANSLKKCRC